MLLVMLMKNLLFSLHHSFLTDVLENIDKIWLFATIADAAFTFQKMLRWFTGPRQTLI